MRMLNDEFPDDYGFVVNGNGDNLLSVGKSEITPLFLQRRVLLFRGFEADIERFKSFTSTMAGDFVDYRGGSFKRDRIQGDPTLLSVTSSEQRSAIPFHGEMHYKRIRPSVLWFYCDRPPSRKGETTLCDGRALYRALSHSTREALEREPIVYRVNYSRDALCDIYESEDLEEIRRRCDEDGLRLSVHDGHYFTEFEAPAVRMNDAGEPCVVNNILPMALAEMLLRRKVRQVRRRDGRRIGIGTVFELLVKSERLGIAVPWKAHDILMIDNDTVMHGRRRIVDSQRRILVRMSA
jgi:alpha-ketoglutarate-dependent taurine dioxygenase